MLKKFSVIAAAGVATVALVACGGYDVTPAADSYAQTANDEIKALEAELGLTGTEAAGASVTFTCPKSVQKDEVFTCTVKGSLTGETIDVEMKVNSSDELVPANAAAYTAAEERLAKTEYASVVNAAAGN
jgi:hypothetical protein